jgi:hypothetical protein
MLFFLCVSRRGEPVCSPNPDSSDHLLIIFVKRADTWVCPYEENQTTSMKYERFPHHPKTLTSTRASISSISIFSAPAGGVSVHERAEVSVSLVT